MDTDSLHLTCKDQGGSPVTYNVTRLSLNKHRNTQTFAYRLSELVFGSLLASYLLGFVAFSLGFVAFSSQMSASTEGTVHVDAADTHPTLRILSAFLRLGGVSDLGTIGLSLTISVFFALFTALLYYRYHQSVLYTATNLRHSATDFLLAGFVGLTFGASMVAPLAFPGWVTLAVAFALWRRRRILVGHWQYMAGALIPPEALAGGRPGPAEPGDDQQILARRKQATKNVADILKKAASVFVARSEEKRGGAATASRPGENAWIVIESWTPASFGAWRVRWKRRWKMAGGWARLGMALWLLLCVAIVIWITLVDLFLLGGALPIGDPLAGWVTVAVDNGAAAWIVFASGAALCVFVYVRLRETSVALPWLGPEFDKQLDEDMCSVLQLATPDFRKEVGVGMATPQMARQKTDEGPENP